MLFFVHGFNNDVKAVIERAWALQTTYNLEVFTFTWPANGGGIKGVASYKSDKRDAIASVGALDRVLEKIRDYVTVFREKRLKELRALARSMTALTSLLKPKRKDLLFFVHGFNNDVKAVVERAWALQTTYNLEVFTFTWPANGGGIKGVASYKSDKRDAIASVGALDRVLEKIRDYVTAFREERLKELRALAESRSRNSREAESELFARLSQKDCPFRVNLMLHSMGNYLFKNLLRSSSYHGDELIFDNVILAAADTNNLFGHREFDFPARSLQFVEIARCVVRQHLLRDLPVKCAPEELFHFGVLDRFALEVRVGASHRTRLAEVDVDRLPGIQVVGVVPKASELLVAPFHSCHTQCRVVLVDRDVDAVACLDAVHPISMTLVVRIEIGWTVCLESRL